MTSKKAYSYLVKILSFQDFSEHKLRKKLQGRNFSTEEIEEAITEVKSKNFLREDNYIEARIKAFMNKGYSPEYIQQKLSQEHLQVSEEIIQAVFNEYSLTTDEQIRRLATKKMRNDHVPDHDDQNKILRYLLSKGHDYSQSKKILKLMILA